MGYTPESLLPKSAILETMEIVETTAEAVSKSLIEIPEPPGRLWLSGTLPLPSTKYLCVVGSRALTPYGREVTSRLIAGLAGYPISIVSGLALGADSAAHRAALSAGLHTIAIPGSGLGESALSPRSNVGLAKDILQAGGALLSEHPPEYLPHAYDFPSRNRIMVGMADAVLMIEAGEKSGTLITARLAGEYGRELLCVPHRIGDFNGYGSQLFLRLGATLVSEPSHILEALRLTPTEQGTRTLPLLGKSELSLWTLLETPHSRDDVIRVSGLPASEAITLLVTLELKGLVKEEYGLWRRNS